jgi:RHH-type proline utilization regulon transcriptional repressor/proline dehydrogenase/delta 1-pyrroline-5-carboxylate dehydrogenase
VTDPRSPTDDLQADIERIGGAIRDRMGAERPGLFAPGEWKGRVMARAMADEDFRVALFRFVDVLPAVGDDARLLALAREYFEPVGAAAAQAVGWTVKALGRGGPFRAVASKVLRHQVGDLARQFIAGETERAALGTLKKLWDGGCAVSVDLLGEVTVSRAEAEAYGARYLALLDALHGAASDWPERPELTHDDRGPVPAVNVSVKLSALDPLLTPLAWDASVARARDALRPILAKALELGALGAHVQVDMEHHALKDLTLAAVRGVLEEPAFARGPSCGVVLQAYLRDAPDDLEALAAWARARERPLTVRLVKGAYWDQEVVTHRQAGWPVPVWEDKADTDRTYEAMSVRLLEERDLLRPAFGGHNLRSIAHAAAVAGGLGVPKSGYELQVIHGMAEPLRRALVAEGYRVRAYCPVGAFLPGMAYLVRRLLENTANTSMLRQMYGEERPVAELLAAPRSETVPATAPTAPEADGEGFANVPHAHFAGAIARRAFADALERVKGALGAHHPAVIDGRPVDTAARLDIFDPSCADRAVGTSARCGPAEAGRALAGAERAAAAWGAQAPEARAEVLERAADLLVGERWDLAALQVFEVGKGWEDADGDVAEAIDFLRYYAREIRRLGPPKRLGAAYPGEVNTLAYRPRGVGVVIPPWNFPLAIPAGMTAAALAAGNAVVLKPSERAPLSGAALHRVLTEAGVPEGVLQFVPGDGSVGAALAADPRTDFVAFTGSREVGLSLVRAAAEVAPGARGVKAVIAEMGGKNPVIVDETADLDEAVLGIVRSATGFQGQKCSACSRVIVHRAVHDALVARLVAAIDTLPVGPAEDPASRIGPMVDARARDKVLSYIELGRREAHPALVVEGVPVTGHFVGPAVFTGVAPGHRLFREEVFGPVLAVTQAADLEAAIELANDSDYALTAGIYSRSPAAIARATAGLEAGNIYVNRGITGALVGRQPFGGHRLSGVGSKVGGPDYVRQFLRAVSVSENTLRRGFAPGRG